MITTMHRRGLLATMPALAFLAEAGAASDNEGHIIQVGDGSELARALALATAGTTIVLADGIYDAREGFVLDGQGEGGAPIVVRAARLGGARLTSALLVRGGASTWLWGLNFQGAAARLQIVGERHKVIGCRFANFGRADIFTQDTAINLPSRTDFLEIAYCLFEHPAAFAPWRNIELDGQWPQWRFGIRGRHEPSAAPYDLHIHHCHFRHFPAKPTASYRSAQADAIEIAPIGSDFDTRNIIEYCLMENINDSTGGSICDIKAGRKGLFQYNTAINCPGRVDIRSAREWTLQHNWLENTQGIAAYGQDHRLIANQLVGEGDSIRLLRGNGDENFSGAGRQRVVNCLVRCNSGTLRIGTDWSSDPLENLPLGVRMDGHQGAVSIQPGASVTQQPDYSCLDSSEAFKLTASQVGPMAAPRW